MDAQEALMTQASVVAAVLARGMELALVELTGKPEAVNQSAALRVVGFTFHGLVGLMADGRVGIAASKPLDVECMFAMGGAVTLFSQLMSASQKVDDSADWCERLMQLPDTRSEFGSDA